MKRLLLLKYPKFIIAHAKCAVEMHRRYAECVEEKCVEEKK